MSKARDLWDWRQDAALACAPIRCKKAKWYLIRARLKKAARADGAAVGVRFLADGEAIAERYERLLPVPETPDFNTTDPRTDGAVGPRGPVIPELFGWAESPRSATHLQVRLVEAEALDRIEDITFRQIGEPDPAGHPLANPPPWSQYRPPFAIGRVLLPEDLRGLAPLFGDAAVEVLKRPTRLRALAKRARGAACIVDPTWAARATLADLQRLAEGGWAIVDLETLARAMRRSARVAVRVVEYQAPHDVMAAQCDYADVATRGLVLADCVPYGTIDVLGAFGVRALRADRAWKRFADKAGFATLLSARTPWERRCGDVLTAACATAGGELIASDLPWLVAGRRGRLVGPHIARHLLRMHLGQPLADGVQFWRSTGNDAVLIRDIADLARRYAPLRALRWAAAQRGAATLGVAVVPPGSAARPPQRGLMIQTGRVDAAGPHDGFPAEPMMIFFRELARQVRDGTAWARRYLADRAVLWQFEAAGSVKYATMYDSATGVPLPAAGAMRAIELRCGAVGSSMRVEKTASGARVWLDGSPGLYGDGSIEVSAALNKLLFTQIEQAR